MSILHAASLSSKPVSPADLKRARYFGLTIPAPVKLEADLGDSWSSWDDATDRPWVLGPEAEPIEPIKVPAPAPALTKLAIHGFTYEAREIPAGECGTIAFEVLKDATNNRYAVIRNHFGQVTCDCPSYVCTHEGTAGMCKHGSGLVGAGLVPSPTPVPAATRRGEPTQPTTVPIPADVLDPRPVRRRRFDPSPEEMAEAAQLFADLAAGRVAYHRELAAAL